MSRYNHKIEMTLASLMDAIKALSREKPELAREHLAKAEKDLFAAIDEGKKERLVDTFR